MIAAIRHIALVVRDLQSSYEFYHRLFALQQVRHRPGRAIHLSDGFFNLTLLGKRDRTPEESETILKSTAPARLASVISAFR